MSTASIATPTSPSLYRDIRAPARPFKRDKDHSEKWSCGTRELGGRPYRSNVDLNDVGAEPKWAPDTPPNNAKSRPGKPISEGYNLYKCHANKNPRNTAGSREYGSGLSRIARKIEAQVEASSSSDLSRSMLDLLPRPISSTSFSAQSVRISNGETPEFLEYESPSRKGRAIGLGGLIEKAEEEFMDKQTELMVKEDYEVLDADGERVVLKNEKKRKASPKQKAAKAEKLAEEDDGFELI